MQQYHDFEQFDHQIKPNYININEEYIMIIKGEPIKPKLAKIALFKIISKWYGDKSNT